jgi:serine/threonine-protein kinase
MDELPIGAVINGKYQVEKRLGRGGSGSVYQVKHLILQKSYAIKILAPVTSTNSSILKRFQKEARVLSDMDHPNLVKAIDCGLIDDQYPYVLMDLVQGTSLDLWLTQRGRFSVSEAVEILLPVLEALQYAHDHGVVHRDIKPSNIMLVQSKDRLKVIPKIVDFGIAKVLKENEESKLTKTGDVFGAPTYFVSRVRKN